MTAVDHLRTILEALPRSEFLTPKLIKAEKAARAYMAEVVARQVSDSEAIASTPFDSKFGFSRFGFPRKPQKAKKTRKVKR